MAGNTPRLGLTFLEDTDPLAQVAAVTQQLAADIENVMPATGTVSVAVPAAGTAFVQVTFPEPFAEAPVGMATLRSTSPAGPRIVSVSNETTTGMRVNFYNGGAALTLSANWSAAQVTT